MRPPFILFGTAKRRASQLGRKAATTAETIAKVLGGHNAGPAGVAGAREPRIGEQLTAGVDRRTT